MNIKKLRSKLIKIENKIWLEGGNRDPMLNEICNHLTHAYFAIDDYTREKRSKKNG